MQPAEKHLTLAKSLLCAEMTSAEIKDLAPFVQTYALETGTEIYEEGDTEAFLCLIVSGSVSVYKVLDTLEEKQLAVLGVGETVGEMSVIDEMPRSACAKATTPATLYALTRRNLIEYKKSAPISFAKLIYNIAVLLCQRLRETNKLVC